jgi:hypothetical protein
LTIFDKEDSWNAGDTIVHDELWVLININGQQDINKVFEDIDVLLGALQN